MKNYIFSHQLGTVPRFSAVKNTTPTNQPARRSHAYGISNKKILKI